jgi:hypothetical protein
LGEPLIDETFDKESLCLLCRIINRDAFSEYKNAFVGKDVAIVGAGPTLNDYVPLKNAIHIGTNRTHMNKKLKLDFLFRQDFKNYDKEIFQCQVKKFIGYRMCPESTFLKLTNAKKFVIDFDTPRIPIDIDIEPLWHGGSVAFSAIQFALWGNPKRIFIVGCDCAGQNDPLHWHHFDDKDTSKHNLVPIKALLSGWEKIAGFASICYPDVEIISVNPVGLKGMFKDIYTEKYTMKNLSEKEKR